VTKCAEWSESDAIARFTKGRVAAMSVLVPTIVPVSEAKAGQTIPAEQVSAEMGSHASTN
jgi:hypothetical protein